MPLISSASHRNSTNKSEISYPKDRQTSHYHIKWMEASGDRFLTMKPWLWHSFSLSQIVSRGQFLQTRRVTLILKSTILVWVKKHDWMICGKCWLLKSSCESFQFRLVACTISKELKMLTPESVEKCSIPQT